MIMKLETCSNELGWLIRCHNCIVDNCPEEDYPPRPLPIPPGYTENLERKMRKSLKGKLPPTLKLILKTCYPLPARQAPVHPKHPEISSGLQSPMPYTEHESLGDDQTKSASFGAQQADGREKEQLETSLAVQPDDMTSKHRDGEQNPLERPQVSENEDKVVADGTSHADQGEIFVFQAEVRMNLETSQVAARRFVRQPIVRQQREATSRSTDRGGNYPIQADFGGKSETATTDISFVSYRPDRWTTQTRDSEVQWYGPCN